MAGAILYALWIQTTALAFPKEAQSLIFTMCQRLTDDRRGTGIGLAIVRRVVEQMVGQVIVESEIGKGSPFWVDLERASGWAAMV